MDKDDVLIEMEETEIISGVFEQANNERIINIEQRIQNLDKCKVRDNMTLGVLLFVIVIGELLLLEKRIYTFSMKIHSSFRLRLLCLMYLGRKIIS